jgi:hypothetical protein
MKSIVEGNGRSDRMVSSICCCTLNNDGGLLKQNISTTIDLIHKPKSGNMMYHQNQLVCGFVIGMVKMG